MNDDRKTFILALSAFFIGHRRIADALILSEALLALMPDDSDVLKHLGYCRLKAGDAHGCLAALEKWTSKEKSTPPLAHLLRAQAMHACGRHDDASQSLRLYVERQT